MIQSVMAKAEMADMGIPVDTSAPSSTNLPSSTSQALTQQRQQHEQQIRHQQQQQQQQEKQVNQQQPNQFRQPINEPQMHMQPQQTSSSINHYNDGLQHMQQNQQNVGQKYQQQLQQPHSNMMMSNNNNLNLDPVTNNFGQQSYRPQDGQLQNSQSFNPMLAQQQQQQQQFLQQQQQQSLPNQQGPLSRNQQVAPSNQVNFLDTIPSSNQLSALEQQTQQLVGQINSQFSLNGAQGNTSGQQAMPISGQNNSNEPQQIPPRGSHIANNPSSDQSIGQQNMMLQQSNPIISQQPQFMQDQFYLSGANPNCENLQQASQPQYGMSNQQRQQLNPIFPEQQQPNQAELSQFNNQPVNFVENKLPTIQQQERLSNQNLQRNQIDSFVQQNPDNLNRLRQLQQQSLDSSYGPTNILANQQQPYLTAQEVNQSNEQALNARPIRTNLHQLPIVERDFSQHKNDGSYDSRRDIRFGPQITSSAQDYDQDHALSDHELHTNRRGHRETSQSAIRRYDSVETKSPKHSSSGRELDLAYDRGSHVKAQTRLKARQLPQPSRTNQHQQAGGEGSLQSSIECLKNDRQKHNKSRDGFRSPVSKPTRKQLGRDQEPSKHPAESPQYLTDSDVDGDLASGAELSENEPSRRQTRASNRALPNQKNIENSDKHETALQLLSELKLTEQANQVMEQQQLLIKQSQELIKLQQAQLEQKILLDKKETKSNGDEKESIEEGEKNSGGQKQTQEKPIESETEIKADGENETDESSHLRLKKTAKQFKDETVDKQTSKKSTSFSNDQESDLEEELQSDSKRGQKVHSIDNNEDSAIEYDRKADRHHNKGLIKKANNPSTPKNTTSIGSSRYNRDLLQSPTDTTDSDVELMSQSTIHKRHRQAPTKPKPTAIRRKEPAGLPPSPLPVAAAIQLHHMQQQHLKQQMINRANLLRSRSVTNSPNQFLDRGTSGYMTDSNQRHRATSPDTMSEYGGQRRRKRLPEPPSNVVPLTPSMVRKMIQAQRAVASNSSKILTSVNAQTTLLGNIHSDRASSLDQQIGESDGNTFSKTGASSGAQKYVTYGDLTSRASLAPSNVGPKNSLSRYSQSLSSNNPQSSTTDVNRFLKSTYGSSILKNPKVSEIKETPELDKMISNIDEYYGFDEKRYSRFSPSSGPDASNSLGLRYGQQTPLADGSSPMRLSNIGFQSNQADRVGLPPSSQSSGLSSSYRRNSEGGSVQQPTMNYNFSSRRYTNLQDSRSPNMRVNQILPTVSQQNTERVLSSGLSMSKPSYRYQLSGRDLRYEIDPSRGQRLVTDLNQTNRSAHELPDARLTPDLLTYEGNTYNPDYNYSVYGQDKSYLNSTPLRSNFGPTGIQRRYPVGHRPATMGEPFSKTNESPVVGQSLGRYVPKDLLR